MGVLWSHNQEANPNMAHPDEVVDINRVGDVYLAMYDAGIPMNTSEKTQLSRSHWSIIIDVAGESNEKMIVGQELHLGADTKTRKTSFIPNRRFSLQSKF